MNEANIIQQVLAGDTEAYEPLVTRYHVGLIIHCERITGNRDAAEDIAQAAFIKAFHNLHSFNSSKGRFSTWLYTVATNGALNYLRDNKRTLMSEDIELVAEPVAPDYEVEAAKREVREAVAVLQPPTYRQVIEAYYWRGESYQSIAESLGIPINTVRTWLRRAKEQLRSELS